MPRRPRLSRGGLAYRVLNRRVGRLPLFEGVDNAILPASIKARNLPFHAWDPDYLAKLIEAAP